MVFLELAVAIAQQQMASGDYFLIENPATSAARRTAPIEALLDMSGVLQVFGDMCRYGLRHPCGLPMRKPTWWLTNAPQLGRTLGLRCQCRGDHAPCMGQAVTKHAARYTPALAKCVVEGLRLQLQKDAPDRMRELHAALVRQIRSLKMRTNRRK